MKYQGSFIKTGNINMLQSVSFGYFWLRIIQILGEDGWFYVVCAKIIRNNKLLHYCNVIFNLDNHCVKDKFNKVTEKLYVDMKYFSILTLERKKFQHYISFVMDLVPYIPMYLVILFFLIHFYYFSCYFLKYYSCY